LITTAENDLKETLEDLNFIQQYLIKQREDIVFDEDSKDEMEIDDELWNDIVIPQEKLHSYQNAVIEKWSSKAHFSSGITANKFKSLNQSIPTQIEKLLSGQHKQKIIERTQARSVNVIGKDNDEEHDENLYDDSEFYQSLFKELIQSGVESTNDPIEISKAFLKLKRLRQRKKRKNVDRRASKGRKIRYEEHEKLLNYMTSQPNRYPEKETGKGELIINSLFGQSLPQ